MKHSSTTKEAAIADFYAGNGGYRILAKRYGVTLDTIIYWIKHQKQTLNSKNRNGKITQRSVSDGYTSLLERSDMDEPELP